MPLANAAEVYEILPTHKTPIQGKEADWIDGDYVLQNGELVAVSPGLDHCVMRT